MRGTTMPEQLTRHPEVTLQVLRSAGAKCGEGALIASQGGLQAKLAASSVSPVPR